MKNIKKILFTITVLCASICFASKALADTSCSYTIDYPFQDVPDQILAAQYKYLQYVFKRAYKEKFGYERNDFSDYINNLDFNKPYISKYKPHGPLIEKITLTLNNNGEKIELVVTGTNYYGDNESVTIIPSNSKNELEVISSCPDLIAMRVVDWGGINYDVLDFEARFSSEYFDKKDKSLDELVIDAFQSIRFLEYHPLIFFSDELKTEMAQVYVYIGYYGFNFDDEYNIDSIVNKYLYIDGMKDILNSINENLDESSGVNIVEIEEMNEELADEIIDKIADEVIDKIGFETIESDLAELNKFNNNYLLFYNNDDYTGVRRVLKDFLNGSGSGLTVTQWFNKYMPDSNAQYVEALEMLLTMLNSDEMRAEKENLNYLEELYKDFNYCLRYHYTIENCKSECEKYYRWDACIYSSNISQCVNSYPSNVCDEKTSQDVGNDVAASEDKIKDHMKDIIDKKLIEYYENYGIEISENEDLCDILLGKNDENGLYVYIKGVLNAIRIGGPILMVVLTAFDAMKSISSFKDDENKKFWNHLKIRLICVAILILVPTIINFLVKLAISECVVEV